MNCRQAKLEIALCVGEDLTDADRRENLRQHLSGCPECRSHFKRLKGMFHVLEQAEARQTYDSADSLWPGLMGRLGKPQPRMLGPRFNGWAPFSVMAAACILLMIVMEMQPHGDTIISSSWFPRGVFGLSIEPDADAASIDVEDANARGDFVAPASPAPSGDRTREPRPAPDAEPATSF